MGHKREISQDCTLPLDLTGRRPLNGSQGPSQHPLARPAEVPQGSKATERTGASRWGTFPIPLNLAQDGHVATAKTETVMTIHHDTTWPKNQRTSAFTFLLLTMH